MLDDVFVEVYVMNHINQIKTVMSSTCCSSRPGLLLTVTRFMFMKLRQTDLAALLLYHLTMNKRTRRLIPRLVILHWPSLSYPHIVGLSHIRQTKRAVLIAKLLDGQCCHTAAFTNDIKSQ